LPQGLRFTDSSEVTSEADLFVGDLAESLLFQRSIVLNIDEK
jgi:hypothetical protein